MALTVLILSGISKKYLTKLLEEFEDKELLQVQGSNLIINDYEQFRLAK